MTFNAQELSTIESALGVAASAYKDDAQIMRDTGQPRLADQFDAQAAACRAIADRIAQEG